MKARKTFPRIPVPGASSARSALRSLARALLLASLASGCSSDGFKGTPAPNRPPSVRVTGGPPVRTDGVLVRDVYSVKIQWSGWDDDGRVDHFVYAIDIDRDAIDRNPVTGDSDGDPVPEINDPRSPITWTRIDGFEGSFLFSATTPDSTTGLNPEPTGTFAGNHTFYIRSVDDEGAFSSVAHISFTATTVAPRTTLLVPKITGDPLGVSVGTDIFISWEGEDDDAVGARKTPKHFEYKLIETGSIFKSPVVEIPKDPGPWTRVSGETTSVRFEGLEVPKIYAFAVRAVDEAGAVEPFLEEPRNTFRFQVLQTAGFPLLTVNEPTLGGTTCVGTGAHPVVFEVPVGVRLRFEMTADASTYGSAIGGYNWGVDLADPSDEGPESGWRGWSGRNFTDNFPVFTQEGTHYVYLRARDTGSPPRQSLCIFQLDYIEFPRDRGILYVDDSFTGNNPTDLDSDRYFATVLDTAVAMGKTGAIDVYEAFGAADNALDATAVKLRLLSRYKLVVWNTTGSGRSGTGISAWRRATTGIGRASERVLPPFVKAGGQVWVMGIHVAGATIPVDPFVYPKTELQLKRGVFAYDFLQLCTTKLDKSAITTPLPWDGMIGAVPTPGAAGAREGYPELHLDESLIRTSLKTFGECETVHAPFDPLCPAGLDTLYTYRSYGSAVGRRSSSHGRPCGFRFASRAPVPEQGKIVYFGFPLHFFRTSEVKVLCAKIFDWFSFDGAPERGRS